MPGTVRLVLEYVRSGQTLSSCLIAEHFNADEVEGKDIGRSNISHVIIVKGNNNSMVN